MARRRHHRDLAWLGRSYPRHRRDRAVDDADRVVSREEADTIADGQHQACAVAGRRDRVDCDVLAFDEAALAQAAPHLVADGRGFGIGPGDDQRAVGCAAEKACLDVVDRSSDCGQGALGLDKPATRRESLQRLRRGAAPEARHRLARPSLALSHDRGDASGLCRPSEDREARTRAYARQLAAISDGDEAGAGCFDSDKQRLHFTRAEQAGLINDEN